MAVRVLIAEDDALARYGLRTMLSRHVPDILLVGEAENGRDALEMALEMTPDIVITDVKMPVMDGIELIRALKERTSGIRFILLSAYSDFEYVREGMRLGAEDYLLKLELDETKLITLIEDIAEQISSSDDRSYDEMDHTMCIRRILIGTLSSRGAIVEALEQEKIELTEDNLFVVVIKRNEDAKNGSFVLSSWKFLKGLNASIAKIDGTAMLCAIESDLFAGIISSRCIRESRVLLDHVCQKMKQSDMGNITVRVAGPALTFEKLSLLFYSLVSFDDWHFTLRVNEKTGISASVDYSFKMLLDILRSKISNGDASGIRSSIEAINEEIRKHDISSVKILHSICYTILYFVDSALDDRVLLHNRGWNHSEHLMHLIRNCRQVSEYQAYLKDLTNDICALCPDSQHQSILIAKEYINTHYMLYDLSLEVVAQKVGLSSSYFSRLFMHNCGESFVEYLTKLRIEKAKQMLAQTNEQAQVIAARCGYSSTFYFSRLFKKKTGLTPINWRKEHRNIAE